MKLYSRRMQIEQNFRDEKSERFGFGLRASYSRSAGRIQVLSLLATLSTIVLWLLGFHAENKGIASAISGQQHQVSPGDLIPDVSEEYFTAFSANAQANIPEGRS